MPNTKQKISTQKNAVIRRRLLGNNDLIWIFFVTLIVGIVVATLISYLKVEFKIYRLANERAVLVAQGHDLAEQQRQLELEKQVRAEQAISLEDIAQELDLGSPRSNQVYNIEENE